MDTGEKYCIYIRYVIDRKSDCMMGGWGVILKSYVLKLQNQAGEGT